MRMLLKRIYNGKTYTIGKLYCNGEYFCDTLEDVVRTKGIQLDLNNDEPQAYLTGWLTQELHQRIFNY